MGWRVAAFGIDLWTSVWKKRGSKERKAGFHTRNGHSFAYEKSATVQLMASPQQLFPYLCNIYKQRDQPQIPR